MESRERGSARPTVKRNWAMPLTVCELTEAMLTPNSEIAVEMSRSSFGRSSASTPMATGDRHAAAGQLDEHVVHALDRHRGGGRGPGPDLGRQRLRLLDQGFDLVAQQ